MRAPKRTQLTMQEQLAGFVAGQKPSKPKDTPPEKSKPKASNHRQDVKSKQHKVDVKVTQPMKWHDKPKHNTQQRHEPPPKHTAPTQSHVKAAPIQPHVNATPKFTTLGGNNQKKPNGGSKRYVPARPTTVAHVPHVEVPGFMARNKRVLVLGTAAVGIAAYALPKMFYRRPQN